MHGPSTSCSNHSNTFTILIATDLHLGYKEKDAERRRDSLITFEEVLLKAQEYDVDFILLGGDMFHANKPSRHIVNEAMSLIRQYCHGDKACAFQLISDKSVNFGHTSFPHANHEDPHLKIRIPIFTIHGNHDDPIGLGNLCAIDVFHTAGLINYFGKSASFDHVEINPILLQKGTTKLALYGLGAMKDERLHKLFDTGKVQMIRPQQDTDSCFNCFVFHQNRAAHTPTNHIPESFLPDFLDLVIWGHEHECKVQEQNKVKIIFVYT